MVEIKKEIEEELISNNVVVSEKQIDETSSFALQLVQNEGYTISEAVLIATECTLDCINS